MGYALQDRIEISVFVDGTEYPLDNGNTLDFLQIGSVTKGKLPTFHMGLTDQQHNLDNIQLQDAIPIRIVIKGYNAPTVSYPFRKFNHTRKFNGACYVYEVDGYWDSPLFWAGTTLGGIRGTSDSVLSQLANTCGLKYNGGANTNDSQLWMPRNRTYGDWAKRIASRGYISDNSYMFACVDLTGTLLYKDINALPTPQVQVVHNQMVQGAFTSIDYASVASSGLNNQVTGYWNSRFEQSTVAATSTTEHSSLTFDSDSRSPLYNTTMREQTQRGMQTYAPIDVGNVHSAYERAMYQNQRFANLYNMDVQFLMTQPTTLDLLQTFTFSVTDENDKKDLYYSGDYIISARAIFVKGTVYAEKLIGTRHGVNATYVNG